MGETTLVLNRAGYGYSHGDGRDQVHTTLTLVVPPADEPLELAFVRDDHLRVSNGTAEDAYISRLITTTRRAGEKVTRRAWYGPQTWEQAMDRFPCGAIYVQRPPLIAVASITYLDADGAEQTLAPADYKVSNAGWENRYSRIMPAYGKVWPTARCEMDAVVVTFTAGYVNAASPTEAAVPDELTHGQLLMIGELYKQRSESVQAYQQQPAMIRARQLWAMHKVGF
jgi:uncharacterized phiE125 gp8 family phage protein